MTPPWTVASVPGSSVRWIFQARILEWVIISFSRGSPQPGIEPASPDWQVDSLPLSDQGSPKDNDNDNDNQHLKNLKEYVCVWVAQLYLTLCNPIACQAPLSMELSRQEYWSRWPFPSPGDLPNPGIKLWSPALQADSLPPELLGKLQKNLQIKKF